jgi:glutamine synthetase adenylyltransferase
MEQMDKIEKLKNRQLARLLAHLKKTGQLTVELEKDLKRAYRYAFEDVEELIQRLDKEKGNGEPSN